VCCTCWLNAGQLKLWNNTLKDAASSNKDNAYKRYLKAFDEGRKPTKVEAESAYAYIRARAGKNAENEGINFNGEVHHWNYNKENYSDQVVNPANLSQPIDRDTHTQVHRETQNGTNTFNDPIKQENELDINAHPIYLENIKKPDFYVGSGGSTDTLPATGYRLMRYKNDDGTINKYAVDAMESKESRGGYVGFTKYDNAEDAADAFQIKLKKHVDPSDPTDRGSWSDARLEGKFDTLQLYENGKVKNSVRVPRKYGDSDNLNPTKPSDLEPFTEVYPQYGKGGEAQLVTGNDNLKFDSVTILPKKSSK